MEVWKECRKCGKKLSTFVLSDICPDCGGLVKVGMTPRARLKGAAKKKYGRKK